MYLPAFPKGATMEAIESYLAKEFKISVSMESYLSRSVCLGFKSNAISSERAV